MSRRSLLLSAMVVFWLPVAANAFFVPVLARRVCYYPAGVYYRPVAYYAAYPGYYSSAPVLSAVPVTPPPAYLAAPQKASAENPAPGNGWAQPQSAPPSGMGSSPPPPLAGEPPAVQPPTKTMKQSVEVTEPGSYYDAYTVVPRTGAKLAADRCSVGFRNLTDRDLTVVVDGQSQVIARGKSQPMQLGRQFVWRIEGREPQTERLASGETGLEIVIRR